MKIYFFQEEIFLTALLKTPYLHSFLANNTGLETLITWDTRHEQMLTQFS